ncbi:MAG: sugar phosphate isomerase/epimerase [Clostridia bacterium]|nr:sugar phosphate isomerase/epimerase [Clostridia bacterium]
MKLVTQTEVLSARISDEAAVRIICESGFDGLDYSMFKMSDDDDILNTNQYKTHVKNLADIASSYGKTFEQAHSPFPSCREGNAEYNVKMFDKLKRSLEIAGMLDAKICVVHPVQFSSNQKEQNMELYQKLEPYAAEYGVKIALENMWGWDDNTKKIYPNVCSVASEFNDYFDSLNTKNFTTCLDLGHCGLVGDDAASMIREMGGERLGALHVHDNDFINDSHMIPYTMDMDWESILTALGEINYKGNFTYEADTFLKKFPVELLPSCVRFMHDLGRIMIGRIESCRVKK